MRREEKVRRYIENKIRLLIRENSKPITNSQKDEDEISRYLEIYRIYRSYIKDESELISARVQWIIRINAFVFAAAAVLLKIRFDLEISYLTYKSAFSVVHFATLRTIIDAIIAATCLVTAIICHQNYKAIKSAKLASKTIGDIFDRPENGTTKWHNGKKIYEEIGDVVVLHVDGKFLLPHIKGGG